MDTGDAFSGYEEGPLLFRPTYRYDLGTDVYDTSEKMRIPAWTGKSPCLLFKCHGVDSICLRKTGFCIVDRLLILLYILELN